MSRYRKQRSYYAAGGQRDSGDLKAWAPRVDKNPFYRTMDILNGIFKKNIKLSAGKYNSTDLKTIFVDFGELRPSRIVKVIGPGNDAQHAVYELECGHQWEGKTTDKDGNAKVPGEDWGMCGICGADQIYRGFEHEWQHIIFKSDLVARKIFCDQYADQLVKQAPHVDRVELEKFLSFLVNVFDDLRVNSLWEKIYPGSAAAIWDRWRYFTHRMGDEVNKDFMKFIMAIAFGLPTNPQGELEPMRPVVEWAVKKVKYKGFANMLIDIRAMLDRCMGALLAKIPAPKPRLQPPPPPSLSTPQQGASDEQEGSQEEEERGSEEGQPDQEAQPGGSSNQSSSHRTGNSPGESNSPRSEDSGSEQDRTEAEEAGPEDYGAQQGGAGGTAENEGESGQGAVAIPSASKVPASGQERSDALQRLMQGAAEIDPKEQHAEPSVEDLDEAKASQALRALLMKALNQDISDLADLDALMPTGDVDDDMQRQLDQLQHGAGAKSESSLLTGNAKAKVRLIPVTKEGTATTPLVELDEEERFYINRMRSAFFRTLGRQKAKRAPSGNQVDVQALIQYRGDHQDPNVFENEDVNQGFAYSVLCDMSGSMSMSFPIVCKAVEMLKEALHFPFVVGNLWGFRGGERVPGAGYDNSAEVWMYRYARDVNWYQGTVPYREGHKVIRLPVNCGGITPMNSAINVSATHLWRRMPAGMAKRMFLLTDGSPLQMKVSGAQIPDFILRQFVAKEIRDARKHGIQVYTIVIGDHAIPEEQCLQMFGPRKYWRRVGQEKVGSALANLVLSNFSKYIRARG